MTESSLAETLSVDHLTTIRQELATGEPSERHAWAVHAIHMDTAEQPVLGRLAIEQCRAFIAAGVPCTHTHTEMYASAMLLGHAWPEALEAEIADLMRLYIRGGYFRMNNQLDAFGATDGSSRFNAGQTCLERAIRSGNIPAAVVLVEEGERVDLVPMTGVRDEAPFTDMIAMAARWWDDAEFPARLTEAAMRRHIAVNSAPLQQAKLTSDDTQDHLPPARHRRNGL